MSPDAFRQEARQVLAEPVDDRESCSHLLARLWSAGTPAARALRDRYNREDWKSPINDNMSCATSEINFGWAENNPELFARDVREFQERYPVTVWRHKIDLSLRGYVKFIAIRRKEPFESVKDYLEHENGNTFLRETTYHG